MFAPVGKSAERWSGDFMFYHSGVDISPTTTTSPVLSTSTAISHTSAPTPSLPSATGSVDQRLEYFQNQNMVLLSSLTLPLSLLSRCARNISLEVTGHTTTPPMLTDSIELRGIRIVRDIRPVSSNVNAQYVDGKSKSIN